MRRTLLMIAAVALLLTQCRKPVVEYPTAGPANENMVSMTVTVGHGRTLIGADGTIKWSAGDKLYVGDGSKYIGCLELKSGEGSATGTFSGSVSATESTDFGLYYLGSGDYTTSLKSDPTKVDISFAEQDGLIGNLSDCHIGYGTATGKVKDRNVILDSTDPVTMTSKVAIAYFEFKENGTSDYTGAIKLRGTNIYNKMTVKFSGAESDMFTGKDKGAISLASTPSSDKYVMLVPPADVAEETLNFGNNDMIGTTKFYKGIEANKFYCLGAGEPIAVSVTPWEPTWVDLGLSVKWATCNLGATSPEDYGDYFAWGETETKDYYEWSTYKWCTVDWYHLTKYCTNSTYGTVDNKTVLDAEDDAAHVVWGGDWRMPTWAEFNELGAGTTHYEKAAGDPITIGGQNVSMPVPGCYYVSKRPGYEGQYIFLPAAGYREGAGLLDLGENCRYWSSLVAEDAPYEAMNEIGTVSGDIPPEIEYLRSAGMSIRPVR